MISILIFHKRKSGFEPTRCPMLGLGIRDLFQIGGPNGLEYEFMNQLHSIHRLRVHPLPHSSAAEFFPCTIQEMHWDSLSKKGVDLNRVQTNECKESGLRLGVSDGRNETQVYRRRGYTGPKKVGSSLRKSRITSAFKLTARGRHSLCLRKACAGDAPAPGCPAGHLRPCSQFNAVIRTKNKRSEIGIKN
jgi:hypothetical protein